MAERWALFATGASSRHLTTSVWYTAPPTLISARMVRSSRRRVRPGLGTRRLSRCSPFSGRRSRGRLAHASAGHVEGRPVAVRSVAGNVATRLTLGAGIAEFPSGLQTASALPLRSATVCCDRNWRAARGTRRSCGDRRAQDQSRPPTGPLMDSSFLYTAVVSITSRWDLFVLPLDNSQGGAIRPHSIRRRAGAVLAEWAMGGLRLEPVGPNEVYLRAICGGLQRRLRQRRRPRAVSRGGGLHHAGAAMAVNCFISHRTER